MIRGIYSAIGVVLEARRNRMGALSPNALETAGSSQLVGRVANALTILAWLSIPAIVASVFVVLAIIFGVQLSARAQTPAMLSNEQVFVPLVMFPLVVASAVTIPIVLLAATRMWSFQLRGLAITGTVLFMIPVNIISLVGIPIGIWALLVLLRTDVRDAFDRHSVPIDHTREQLTKAGTWLVVAGIVSLVCTTVCPVAFGIACELGLLAMTVNPDVGFSVMIFTLSVGILLSTCQLAHHNSCFAAATPVLLPFQLR